MMIAFILGGSSLVKRRTISLPESVDETVRNAAQDGESYSAAVARLVEAGVRALDAGNVPSWIASGASGLQDLGVNSERYIREALRQHGGRRR
jgi:hypothetical protein